MSDPAKSASFLDLELKVEVWLADEEIEMRRLLALDQGDSLRLSRDPDEPVDLVVNGSVVASGELVVVDGKFGFRVKSNNDDTGNADAAASGAAEEPDAAETQDATPEEAVAEETA